GAARRAIRGKRALVLASPVLSNEALHLLSGLVRATGGTGAFRVTRGPEAPLPGVKDLALRAERAANVVGAEKLGFTKTDTPLAGLAPGDVLVIADHALTDADLAAANRASMVIVVGTTMPAGLSNVGAVLRLRTSRGGRARSRTSEAEFSGSCKQRRRLAWRGPAGSCSRTCLAR